ncbi:MAG: glycoside hydrolase family 32 protein [Thermomicrobiales bacterium]|nr:glycoside hydrolase family 32 protein [Thermomicrobiales bacterium]
MTDPHRPVYHLMPERNWMNDPNGLVQVDGVFHAFYQHNPYGALWGNMSWGHARSRDLIHWEHLSIAIRQDPDGPDASGCFSGAIVNHGGVPTMVYTGVRGDDELCCVAWPEDDELIAWRKYADNPVIKHTPQDVATTIFRDHTLWRDGDFWYMGVGSGIEGRGGAVLLYRSTDLIDWEYLHPLIVEQPELNPESALISTGWECPDFFFVGEEPALIVCEWDGDPVAVSWYRGEYGDQRFHAVSKGVVDYGDCLYAPQTFRSEDGGRLFFGWMREKRSDDEQVAAGWSGVFSLPREVIFHEDGSLGFVPAAEVMGLRGDAQHYMVSDGGVSTSAACEIEVAATIPVELSWPNECIINWDGEILRVQARDEEFAAPLNGPLASDASLRIFIDHSLVEAFLGDRIALSTRVYREDACWDEATVKADEGTEITVWGIASIW